MRRLPVMPQPRRLQQHKQPRNRKQVPATWGCSSLFNDTRKDLWTPAVVEQIGGSHSDRL